MDVQGNDIVMSLNNFTLHFDYVLYALAFFITVAVTLFMVFFPIQDIPNERSSHAEITPRGAGLGILIAFIGIWIIKGFNGIAFYNLSFCWLLCLGASMTMGLVGLLDDLYNIHEMLKLIFQGIVAIFIVMMGIRFTTFPLPEFGQLPLTMSLGTMITVLWIVGFINAYNFMDGLNGITSVTTMVASIFWYLIAYQTASEIFSFSAVLLIFANLGFLGFNFPKAMIFLGDVGSLFMGSLFAFWAILATMPEFGAISIWTMPMLFCLHLYDVIFTRFHRLYRGHPFMSAHREHVFQLLNRMGWSHSQVVVVYGGCFCFQGMTAYYMQLVSSSYHLYFFLPYLIIYSHLTNKVLIKARQQGIPV